jgi:hypothetical protein
VNIAAVLADLVPNINKRHQMHVSSITDIILVEAYWVDVVLDQDT